MASLRINSAAPIAGARQDKLEMLLFTLGTDRAQARCETFGIDVLDVLEVTRTPLVTRAPAQPTALDGMVSMRGALMPVIDLARHAGIDSAGEAQVMIVAERNERRVGLLVERVDVICRVAWSAMREPPAMISSRACGLASAVADLGNGKLVMMVDACEILATASRRAIPARANDRIPRSIPESPAHAGLSLRI